MKYFLFLILLGISVVANCQITTTFESFGVEDKNPLEQAANGFAFISPEGLTLYNNYDPGYMFWTGWAISADTDTTTPGFTNETSSIVGSGNSGSQSYAVSYAFTPSSIAVRDLSTQPIFFKGLYISNATYTALSMRDGDSFAKKFGGVDGTDPDFFSVTIDGYVQGDIVATTEHFLADFRSDDSSQDYIQSDWEFVDLSDFSQNFVDSLTFTLNSSDVGMFGMNTPAYFCIDDVSFDILGGFAALESKDNLIEIGPNPVQDEMRLVSQQTMETITLIDTKGNVVTNVRPDNTRYTLSLSQFPSGIYTILVTYEGHQHQERIVKL
jgi:hypothetical protein